MQKFWILSKSIKYNYEKLLVASQIMHEQYWVTKFIAEQANTFKMAKSVVSSPLWQNIENFPNISDLLVHTIINHLLVYFTHICCSFILLINRPSVHRMEMENGQGTKN